MKTKKFVVLQLNGLVIWMQYLGLYASSHFSSHLTESNGRLLRTLMMDKLFNLPKICTDI